MDQNTNKPAKNERIFSAKCGLCGAVSQCTTMGLQDPDGTTQECFVCVGCQDRISRARSKAMDKQPPDRIYLQIEDECGNQLTLGKDEVTWSQDRIHDSDVEYVHIRLLQHAREKGAKTERERCIKEMVKPLMQILQDARNQFDHTGDCGYWADCACDCGAETMFRQMEEVVDAVDTKIKESQNE